MANYGYLPTRQQDLNAWTADFSAVISAAPTDYGLDVAQATAYAALQTAFADALNVALSPNTRTPVNIGKKDTAKLALIAETRKLVDVCQAWPNMTDDKRRELGIPVRDTTMTRVPVPTTSPTVAVASVNGRLFNIQLRQPGVGNRAKPEGVKMAWLFYFIGEDQPADFSAMTFYGSTTRCDTQIVMPENVTPGTKVWISACWVNSTQKTGPVSWPIEAWTSHSSLNAAA